MDVLSTGLPLLIVLVELGIIIFLLLRGRELNREVERLRNDSHEWAALVMEKEEQLQTMRRIYQGRQIKPIEPPMRRAQRSE
jgi:hypothetical protein